VAEPTPLPVKTAHRFAALDSWRGICALSVVLFHLNAGTHFHDLLNNGYVAVDFFFVLSGFVIGSAYHDRIADMADLTRFSLRRVGRLYPLHLVVLLAYLGLELGRLALGNPHTFTGERSWPAFFADLFLLQGFNAWDLSWNMPAWSISIELWTNLVFAGLALWLGRRLPWVAAGLAAVMTVLLILTPPIPSPFPQAEIDILNGAFQCVMEFFLGVAGFSLFTWAKGLGLKPPGWLEWPAVIAAVLTFAYIGALPSLGPAFIFFTVVMIFAFEAGPVAALLKTPAPLRLGEISYSIYLTHSLYTLAAFMLVSAIGRGTGAPWMLESAGRDLLVLGGPWVMDLVAAGCLVAVVISSNLTYRFIEDPARIAFNRLSNHLAPPRRPATATAPEETAA
jgi:peptidoglycan/LPS O-acetylase OafA/YrhL